MPTIKRFEEIQAWKAVKELSNRIYELSMKVPFYQDFGLKDQINRASGSIMDNIAEGFGRDGKKEFIQFLSYAKGSTCEVQSQLYRALDRKYMSQEEFQELYQQADQIAGKLTNLMKYLKNTPQKGPKYD